MNEKKVLLGVCAGAIAIAAGIGALIYFEYGDIAKKREDVASLRTQIDTSRKLIEGTSSLEREVIVLREMTEHIKQVLPDTDNVNNLVRTLQALSEESGVRIRGLKKKDIAKEKGAAFEHVAYTLTLESDAFELLDFMDMAETHERFIRIPRFKLTAAKRKQFEEDGYAAHGVQMDLETFVYDGKNDSEPVKIEGYERKRDLLIGEINRRRQALSVSDYDYRGARGRRDPWVDPRVPVAGDGESALTVQEQMDIVQDLVERTQVAQTQWQETTNAENVIAEMVARADLEDMLASLEEDLRRLDADGSIRYVPSQRRLQLEVSDPLLEIRRSLLNSEGGRGPSVEKLREVLEAMNRHLSAAEYDLMLEAYRLVDGQLSYVENDPLRKPFVDELNRLKRLAETVLDFDQIQIEVGGVAIMHGVPSAALVNGRSVGVGDVVSEDLYIREIRTDEIEFVFRGVILARRF